MFSLTRFSLHEVVNCRIIKLSIQRTFLITCKKNRRKAHFQTKWSIFARFIEIPGSIKVLRDWWQNELESCTVTLSGRSDSKLFPQMASTSTPSGHRFTMFIRNNVYIRLGSDCIATATISCKFSRHFHKLTVLVSCKVSFNPVWYSLVSHLGFIAFPLPLQLLVQC